MLELRTTRLRLVPLSGKHSSLIRHMSDDPEVRRYLWGGEIIADTEAERMVADSQASFKRCGAGFFAMYLELPTDPDHGEFVGFCGHRQMADSEDMELLFGMQSHFWGRGFGQEAALAVLRHGFEQCGLERVRAATDTPNQRSVQVLQRLGMSFVERREWQGLDTVFYEISACEFADLVSA